MGALGRNSMCVLWSSCIDRVTYGKLDDQETKNGSAFTPHFLEEIEKRNTKADMLDKLLDRFWGIKNDLVTI